MRERKIFRPLIYRDWLPIFQTMSEHDRSELLLAIASFPDYEPEGVALWPFFREQLRKQCALYQEKCDKNQRIADERERRRAEGSERTRTCTNVDDGTRTCTNVHECTPNLEPRTYNLEPKNLEPKKETEKETPSPAPSAQEKSASRTHRFSLTVLPSEWKAYVSKVRPDLDAEKEFASFSFYFTQGSGSSKLRSDKGWSQSWQGWVRRAKERQQSAPATNMFTVVKPRRPANLDEEFDDFDIDSFGVAK